MRKVDFGGGGVFCKSAQGYSPFMDTGGRPLCGPDRHLFPLRLWEEEPRVWALLFMLWFASGDCEGRSMWPERVEAGGRVDGLWLDSVGARDLSLALWGGKRCETTLAERTCAFLCQRRCSAGKVPFPWGRSLSPRAFSRISVRAYLFSVAPHGPQRLFPWNSWGDETAFGWGSLVSFTATPICT